MFEFLNDPAKVAAWGAIILAILTALRFIGDALIKIGNTGKYAAKDNDWFDSVGALLLHFVDEVGKILSYIGIGNRQKSSTPEDSAKNG